MSKMMILCLCLLALASCDNTAGRYEIEGAGATFPFPLYNEMFIKYTQDQGISVRYQPIGSGGGYRLLSKRRVDFAGTDVHIPDNTQIKPANEKVYIPICLSGVSLSYNLDIDGILQLTPDLTAGIFLGSITRWDDPRLTELNPQLQLPGLAIKPVTRADASGTTQILSEYLCQNCPEWQEKMGRGTELAWQSELTARGNQQMAEQIKNLPGTIGYLEFNSALQNNLPSASLQNASGIFLPPSLETIRLAAPPDFVPRPDQALAATLEGYPLSSFSWIAVYRQQDYQDRLRALHLVRLLWWMTHEGQEVAPDMPYARLSPATREHAELIIRTITYRQEPILE